MLSAPSDAERAYKDEHYRIGSPKHVHVRARETAERHGAPGVEFLEPFDVSDAADLSVALRALRNCDVVVLDVHGSEGHLMIAGEWLTPRSLDLTASRVRLVVAAVCYQQEDAWRTGVSEGTRVIGYRGKLRSGASRAIVRWASATHELFDLEEGARGTEQMSEWVAEHSHPNAKRSTEWFVTRGAERTSG